MNLRAKLLILLVPLVVVPLLGVGAAAYVQLQQTSERKTLDQMATILDLIAGQTQSVLATARANVQLLSTQNLVRQYLLADDPEERYQVLQSPLLRQLIAYQETYPNYYEIRILMPDGYEDLRWTRVPLPNATEEEGASAWFQAARVAPDDIYSAFVRDPDTGDPALVVSKRIQLRDRTRDGIGVPTKLRGYLVVTIDLGFLTHLLLENVVGEQGFLMVTDTEGKVLIHADRPEANALLHVANGPPTHQSEDPNIGDHEPLPASLFGDLARHAETGGPLRAELSDHLFLFLGKRLEGNLYLFAALPRRRAAVRGTQARCPGCGCRAGSRADRHDAALLHPGPPAGEAGSAARPGLPGGGARQPGRQGSVEAPGRDRRARKHVRRHERESAGLG